MSTTKFELQRNSFGKLILTNEAGEVFEGGGARARISDSITISRYFYGADRWS